MTDWAIGFTRTGHRAHAVHPGTMQDQTQLVTFCGRPAIQETFGSWADRRGLLGWCPSCAAGLPKEGEPPPEPAPEGKWLPNPFSIPRAGEATCRFCGEPIMSEPQSLTGWKHWDGRRRAVFCADRQNRALPRKEANAPTK